MSNNETLRPPKYRHHKGSGQAVVTIAGEDFYLGKFKSAASREAYRRIVAEFLLHGHVSPGAQTGPAMGA